MGTNAVLNTIAPVVDIALAKALEWQELPDDWMKTVIKKSFVDTPTDTIREVVFQAPELPSVKARGEAAKASGFSNYKQDFDFDVLSLELSWPNELKQDLPDFDVHVESKSKETGVNYQERIFQWRTSIMTGSAVDTGLPVISQTCYDGLNLYSTSTRYRTSGGNVVTGHGMTGPTVRADFFSAISRMREFKHDLSGAKIWTSFGMTFLVEFAPGNIETFIEAFEAEFVRQSGGSTQSASNTFLAFAKSKGANVILMDNAYLSGDDWYITVANPPMGRETFLLGEKDPAHVIPLTEGNAADMARTYSEGTVVHGRYTLGGLFPGSTVKVNN